MVKKDNKVNKIKVYSAFDKPEHPGYDFYDPRSPVQQYFRDESDVNNIVAYWTRTGDYTAYSHQRPARYVDCSVLQDFEHALNTIVKAEDILSNMDPVERLKFQDDPIAFIEHFADPVNKESFEKVLSSQESPAAEGSQDKVT